MRRGLGVARVQELQDFEDTLNARLLNQVVLEGADPPCGSVNPSVTKRLIRIAVE
jgi:hypothetical protein